MTNNWFVALYCFLTIFLSGTTLAIEAGEINQLDLLSNEYSIDIDGLSGDEEQWVTEDCIVEPHMVIKLRSPVTGVISRIGVDKGDKVRKGDIIVELHSEVEQALVNLNQAKLEFEKRTVLRNRELFEQRVISTQERDEIELKSELSQLELAAAQARFEQKNIASPIDGVILERMMGPGEYVGDAPMLKIASLNPLYVEAVLPKSMFGHIKPKMEAEVAMEYPVGAIYKAKISVVDPLIDAASGTFGVRLTLPNRQNRIPAGFKCKLRFVEQT